MHRYSNRCISSGQMFQLFENTVVFHSWSEMFSTEDWWGKKNKKRKEKKYLRTSALENDSFIVVFVYLKHCFSRLFLDICRMTLVALKVFKKFAVSFHLLLQGMNIFLSLYIIPEKISENPFSLPYNNFSIS